ncbi:MAG TPA: ATP-binding protein, partial [Gemmataceae bacterium]
MGTPRRQGQRLAAVGRQPSLNKVLVAELMRCGFVDRREAVILIGNPGTGKTHVATALAAEA